MKNIIFFTFFFLHLEMTFATLQVFPLRIVLSEAERNAQISLRHKGKAPMKYKIKTVFYQMSQDGSMKEINRRQKPEESAEGFFRFSPRQVTLEPDVEQVVRLSLRMKPNTPEGEYRVHLHFEEEEASGGVAEVDSGATAKLMLKAKMAVAIPVVVRKGNPQAKVTFDKLKLIKNSEQKDAFSVEMKKEGSAIAFGDIEILSISGDGKQKTIGQINGLSSYIEQRIVSFPLVEAPAIPGKLRLNYKKPVADGGDVLATAEIDLK